MKWWKRATEGGDVDRNCKYKLYTVEPPATPVEAAASSDMHLP